MRPLYPRAEVKKCEVCKAQLPGIRRKDKKYCSMRCKTAAWALRITDRPRRSKVDRREETRPENPGRRAEDEAA